MARAFVDLHCHSRGSFDSLSAPKDMIKARRSWPDPSGRSPITTGSTWRWRCGRWRRRADDHRRRGGQDRRGRPDLRLPRARPSRPGCPRWRRSRRRGSRVAWSGIPHPFDRMRGSLLRDAAMASLAPHVDWVESHNARVVGHGNEDAAAVRDRSGPARHRRLGCALDHGDRRRLHRARRRSVDARRACWPPWPASRSSPAAPPTSSGSGPRSPRASTGCAATAASGPVRRRSTARLGWSPVTDRDGQDHRPMADGTDGPVGSGAMEATPAVDPAFGHHHDPESLVEALEMEPTEVAPISLGAAADPAADDPVDRRPARDHRRSSCT